MEEIINRSYRDVIATKVLPEQMMPMSLYKERNKNKSWEYRRYPKINDNFICISKDGTLGEIFKVGDLYIGLPSSKGKEIINLHADREEAVWKRTDIPKDFIKLEIDYKRDMKKTKGLKRNDIKNKYIADREVLFSKHKDHIAKEFERREHGVFIKIDQEIFYLTGSNYMFLNYYFLAEDKIYPNFRVTAVHTWWHWEATCADSSSWGELRLKSRRVSWSSESCSLALEYFTITKYGEIPVVSENERLAKKLFKTKIVNSFKYYPTFFKPLIDDPNDDPKKELEVTFETDYQETSVIALYPTKAVAYDSTKANPFSINDEVGKYVNTTFSEYRGNHKDCHYQGLIKVVAKAKFGSTSGEFSAGGESFKSEFENSNPLKRNEITGATNTGLLALFVDDCYTMAGFFDKWGYPVVHDPKEPILNEYGDYIEYGAVTAWEADYEKKKKGKKSDLNNFLRQHPRLVNHAFRSEGGINNDFDIDNLNNHTEYLDGLLESELNEKIHVGNLRWEGEPFDSNVVWKPNPRGNIRTTWIPDKELQNLSSVKLFHGKKLRMPDNNHIGALGVDSYDISKTVDGKGSNGAVVGKTKTNFAGAPSNSFFLVYTDRPDKRNDFYDDVIKMCQFFGMYALVENNKPRLLEYMAEKGYRGYSLTRPDKKWSELSPFEKDFGGIPASTQTNKDVASLLKDFITDYIGQGLPHECTCYFGDMVEEWKNFDVNKRKEFDMSVASQLALMACQYKVKQRKTLNIGENDPDKQFSFSSFSA